MKSSSTSSTVISKKNPTISDELYSDILEQKIITEIVDDSQLPYINIYSQEVIYLSSILPILHDFGFVIIDEITYTTKKDKQQIYLNKFNLKLDDVKSLKSSKLNIQNVISDSLLGNTLFRCSLYSLVYSQNLSIKEVLLLRAIIEYIDQSVISINQEMIRNTLTTYPLISKLFVDYFLTKFNPLQNKREKHISELELRIESLIKDVPNITDDKILKITYSLIQNLTRSNYFFNKDEISFKIDTQSFSQNLKGVQPKIEIFVYHPEFSGVHLRMSKISRGGLRWSERHEDYRQEIKSLMLTQESKNSIIIPNGAKGGFVINKEASSITEEDFERIYRAFINNLLDLVDNRIDGEIIRDERIVAYDGDDYYFVVAADKGTASMSDVANEIAQSRSYWLGDAFASGGSNGFGHKDLGITAHGALVSSERFFIERGINIKEQSISIVGIGSMKGDVFGNGMLYSKMFKLFGAVSHNEIFIDPEPDIQASYEERARLFKSQNASWSAYNKEVISKGGGIFFRSQKNIELSEEIKKLLGTTKKSLSGEELAKKVLMMRVDMLFNGGVGTYVKSSDESNLDLGDKQNEAVRLDATELKAKVVCEGGNLGFTQRARIEYARLGGELNLDAIDNAAGVNTSDHEVNLKILLNIIKAKGLISEEDAKKTLKGLTEQVVNQVVWSNYHQSLAISKDATLSNRYLDDFLLSIEVLETNLSSFKRADNFIPKNENISEILCPAGSIVRPIISSLISYSKIFLTNILLESSLVDESFSNQFLFKYFPKSFISAFEDEIQNHPLRREITATVMADKIINLQGSTFIADFNKRGLENFLLKIKAYLITNQLFDANDIRHEIYRNDFLMNVKLQYRLLDDIEKTLGFTTRWMLKYLNKHQVDLNHILDYKDELFEVLGNMKDSKITKILDENHQFNLFFSAIDYLKFAVAAIMVKENSLHTFKDVAVVFYFVVNEFKVLEMINLLNTIETTAQNQKILRYQILQFIEFIVVHFTEKVLEFQRVTETPQEAFKNYLENEKESFDEMRDNINLFISKETKSIEDVSITVNQIMTSIL
ncbi:MAG: NAD-glutamate dehydrogenase [Sulfurimonas sp.]|uniref:NAD-glutamate dehydrogenase domain-containing protein n=1 Tax=Sulfurimonas sp. TaxID=2022749 RepID=UPI0025D5C8F4|nr:NAD-glutamate dehydrogenase domain-containing protein [Sulfurimonas sp.]MCK9492101.1 NAD-glutamate dehydrogenase [Sulfurimonas sp.]